MQHYDDSNHKALLSHQLQQLGGRPGVLPRRVRYGSPEAARAGLVPLGDKPQVIVQPDEIKDVIAECHRRKLFPMYHLEASGLMKRWTQARLNYCWSYGVTANVMTKRAVEGQPPVDLAPNSMGWLVGWRNAGYYLVETIEGVRDRGIASRAFVPKEYELNPRQFREGWEQDALNYRVSEWWDVDTSRGTLYTIQQALTILATGTPLYIAYNWWGHALTCMGLRWDESKPSNIVWQNFNSHDDGLIEMSGRTGLPDELHGIRSTSLPQAA